MRRTIMGAAALAATLLLPLAAHTPMAQGTAPAAAAASPYARVIVKYRAESDLMKKQAMTAAGRRTLQAQTLGDRIGVALTAGIGLTDRSHVVFARGLSSSSLAARIAAQKDVEYAVVDERKHIVAVPNDPRYSSGPAISGSAGGPAVGQWYMKPPGATGTAANTAPSAINAEGAWDLTTGSASVVVAVIDTGIRPEHPDLQGGNVLPGYDMVGPDLNGAGASLGTFLGANDGSGRDNDPTDPGDWITPAEANQLGGVFYHCGPQDSGGAYVGEASSWHGTQTLSLIGAATNNGIGLASVGRNVSVLPVRALGKCGGFDSDIAAGMLWAGGISVPGIPLNPNKARVISMSLGGSGGCSMVYRDAMTQLTAAGVVVVAAAGNDDGLAVGAPANCPGVIAVAGLRSDGDKNGFSNLGPEIAISAPGGNCGTGASCLYPIITATNTGPMGPVASTYSDGFNASLGTSFSTPLVAGTVALMLSAKPSLTPASVKSTLMATARAFPTSGSTAGASVPVCKAPTSTGQDYCYCTTSTCGAGMLDAHAAVAAAIGVQAAISVTTTTPTVGQAISIASSSVLGAGQTATYLWTIVSAGTTGAVITGANNGSTVTVSASAPGAFTISLRTTDNNNFVSTASSVVIVAAAVPPVQAAISVTTTTPTAGQPVAIASSSTVGAGQSIASYQWAIVSAGSTGAVITGASNASTVTVSPTAAGTFTIGLTITDGTGSVSTASSAVNVAAAPAGGGGGALDAGWLLALLSGVLALSAAARLERRRAARAISAPARAWRRR